MVFGRAEDVIRNSRYYVLFCKQKTAYEMRISDWSSDVCSSDLAPARTMTEVRFYHMTRTPLDQALPKMLERTLERGQRAVVRAGSEARVEALSARLWTYPDRS